MRTTHSMSCSGRGPGGDPPTSKELWRQDCCACAVRASSLQTTSWECGRETLSLSIHDKANERTPENESGRRGPRYGASQRPPRRPDFANTSMGHTMTTMVEGFVTRLDARRDGEPANSEVAEASPLPVGMIHKQ